MTVQQNKEVCSLEGQPGERLWSLKGTWQHRLGLKSFVRTNKLVEQRPLDCTVPCLEKTKQLIPAVSTGGGVMIWVIFRSHRTRAPCSHWVDQSKYPRVQHEVICPMTKTWPKFANWSSKTEKEKKSKSRPERDWRTAAGPKESCASRKAH